MNVIEDIKNLTETTLVSYMDQLPTNAEFRLAAKDAITRKGNRYRPLVTATTYSMLGGDYNKVISTGAGLEALHIMSLVADDLPVYDDSALRKGEPAIHIKYGPVATMGALFHLFSLGNHLITLNAHEHAANIRNISSIVYGSINEMILGQELDIKRPRVTAEVCEATRRKNIVYLPACVLPALLLKKDELVPKLDSIGRDISYGHQLIDDLSDVMCNEEQTGKPVGQDEDTLVIRYGVEAAKNELKEVRDRAIAHIRSIKSGTQLEQIIQKILNPPFLTN